MPRIETSEPGGFFAGTFLRLTDRAFFIPGVLLEPADFDLAVAALLSADLRLTAFADDVVAVFRVEPAEESLSAVFADAFLPRFSSDAITVLSGQLALLPDL